MPPSPCRYPTPLPKYGDKSPCKNGVKPCAVLPECWGKSGGDVLKSMNCQQEYVRDLAAYLFANNKPFRSAWLAYVKTYDMPAYQQRLNGLKNTPGKAQREAKEDYDGRLSQYNTGTNSENFATKFAAQQLEQYIAGSNISDLNAVPKLRADVLKTLQSAFSGLFLFRNNKVDFEAPPAGKVCGDLSPYFTFIYNVNILLDEGRVRPRGGKKTKRNLKSKRSTRRN